jgi:hypothetical protein
VTKHELAVLAVDDALKAARDLVKELEQAKSLAQQRAYRVARSRISDAVSTASMLDHHYLRNTGDALEDCARG